MLIFFKNHSENKHCSFCHLHTLRVTRHFRVMCTIAVFPSHNSNVQHCLKLILSTVLTDAVFSFLFSSFFTLDINSTHTMREHTHMHAHTYFKSISLPGRGLACILFYFLFSHSSCTLISQSTVLHTHTHLKPESLAGRASLYNGRLRWAWETSLIPPGVLFGHLL